MPDAVYSTDRVFAALGLLEADLELDEIAEADTEALVDFETDGLAVAVFKGVILRAALADPMFDCDIVEVGEPDPDCDEESEAEPLPDSLSCADCVALTEGVTAADRVVRIVSLPVAPPDADAVRNPVAVLVGCMVDV